MNYPQNIIDNLPNEKKCIQYGYILGFRYCCVVSFYNIRHGQRTWEQFAASCAINHVCIPCHECSCKILNGEYKNSIEMFDINRRQCDPPKYIKNIRTNLKHVDIKKDVLYYIDKGIDFHRCHKKINKLQNAKKMYQNKLH